MRLPSCKLNVYENDIRIPMVFRGPGIAAGTKFDLPASNVDVAPTLLGLAGVDAWAVANMDGKSIVPLVVDPTDPTVPESVKAHIAHQTTTLGVKAENWRKFHFIEYYSLGSVTRTGHLVDDPTSNTYRAVRYVGCVTLMTRPLRFCVTLGNRRGWGVGASHQCPSRFGSTPPLPLYADVRVAHSDDVL